MGDAFLIAKTSQDCIVLSQIGRGERILIYSTSPGEKQQYSLKIQLSLEIFVTAPFRCEGHKVTLQKVHHSVYVQCSQTSSIRAVA